MMKFGLQLTAVFLVLSGDWVGAQTTPTAAAGKAESWVNVSTAFTTQIGVEDLQPAFLNRCQGMIVTPTGDIVIQTAKKGICISTDQGASWSVVAGNNMSGRCENGHAISVAYPYDGRMAFFTFDGSSSGGMSLDGGKTWKSFAKLNRGLEFGDVDWSTREPQTIYGVTHEPYFNIMSDNGGNAWQRLDKNETGGRLSTCVGVIDAKTLTRATHASSRTTGKQDGSIELSEDAGKTWNKVADYQVTGRSLVHYGRKLFWTTSQGVITSSNGKDWALTGAGAEDACHGPYFGTSDQEFVITTKNSFLKTVDGGKTWQRVASAYKVPDIYRSSAIFSYFGWDAKHNNLYASGLGASVYQLHLEGSPGTEASPATAKH